MTKAQKVREFQIAQGQALPNKLEWPDEATLKLADHLIDEEFTIEFRDAVENKNIVEVADALGDLLYVTYWAANAFGIPIDEVFDEIHRSNMTKFIDGHKDPETGKWKKGPSYTPADVAGILEASLGD